MSRKDEPEKLKLGERVECGGYIRKTHNNFCVTDYGEKAVKVEYRDGREVETPVDDFDSVSRFEIVGKVFSGVFVGTTFRASRITCEWSTHPAVGQNSQYEEGYCCRTESRKPFAIVYYAMGRRRLVPLNLIVREGMETHYTKSGYIQPDLFNDGKKGED